ncbi:MAG: NifU family protein [Bdellovibrionota bacterium]
MSLIDDVTVDLEFTPNPNSLKYLTNPALMDAGAANFKDAAAVNGNSPLADLLFKLEGIVSVMIGNNFVTVTLVNHDRLTELNDEVISTIKDFIKSGEQAVKPEALKSDVNRENLSDIEKKIIDILDKEIRPSVAMDGGDITFEKYEDGILFLAMKGACSGCPSSTATLKMGIENRLRQEIPELVEVISI